jgi:hypothetical protein
MLSCHEHFQLSVAYPDVETVDLCGHHANQPDTDICIGHTDINERKFQTQRSIQYQ